MRAAFLLTCTLFMEAFRDLLSASHAVMLTQRGCGCTWLSATRVAGSHHHLKSEQRDGKGRTQRLNGGTITRHKEVVEGRSDTLRRPRCHRQAGTRGASAGTSSRLQQARSPSTRQRRSKVGRRLRRRFRVRKGVEKLLVALGLWVARAKAGCG